MENALPSAFEALSVVEEPSRPLDIKIEVAQSVSRSCVHPLRSTPLTFQSAQCVFTWELPDELKTREDYAQSRLLLKIMDNEMGQFEDAFQEVEANSSSYTHHTSTTEHCGTLHTVQLIVRSQSGESIAEGELIFYPTFSREEMSALKSLAEAYVGQDMLPVTRLYYDDTKEKWDEVKEMYGGVMPTKKKGITGHWASPINNGRLEGWPDPV